MRTATSSEIQRKPIAVSRSPATESRQNRLSPAGLALMNIFPFPNNPADPAGTNWISTPLQPVDTRQDLIRGDIAITDKMNLMVRYINETWVHGEAAGNFWGDTPFPTLASDWEQPSRSFAVKLTNTLSSTAVNEFQFSRAGNDIFVTTEAAGHALNQSIASAFPTVFPQVEVRDSRPSAGATVATGTSGTRRLGRTIRTLTIWKDDFSKVIGSHSTKFGVLFSHNTQGRAAERRQRHLHHPVVRRAHGQRHRRAAAEGLAARRVHRVRAPGHDARPLARL